MMKKNNENSLEEEKEKLNRLVEEAFDKGSPLAQNNLIMEHSCRVDNLVVKAQKEKQKQKHRKER